MTFFIFLLFSKSFDMLLLDSLYQENTQRDSNGTGNKVKEETHTHNKYKYKKYTYTHRRHSLHTHTQYVCHHKFNESERGREKISKF